MTLFTYINQNIDRLKFDMRIGLISCTIMKYWQAYSRYEYLKRLNNPTADIIVYICNDFQVNRDWVYKMIKKMESEV
jgi:hypothetical protein